MGTSCHSPDAEATLWKSKLTHYLSIADGLHPATMFPMSDELLRYRPGFPILDRTTYLISNSLGAMPRGVEDALHHYTDTVEHARRSCLGRRMVDAGGAGGDEIGALMNAPRGRVRA